MRILLIGGRGHLGSRARRALARLPGVEVLSAGRSASDTDVRLDISNPSTLAALETADVVVNVTSSHASAPDRLAEYCLQRKMLLVETSSDRLVMQRLLALRGRGPLSRGTLVLGAGIFTGLSNLLGAAAVSGTPACDRLELAVRSSPFSGAGAGTVDLMLDALRTPAGRVVDGRLQTTRPVERGPAWPVHGQQQTSLLVPLAEPEMLAASCGVPEVSMYMLPKPAALANVFLATPGWLLRSSLYRALLWLQFTLLRRWLLRARPTRVELFARARASATGELAEWSLTAADGMWTAGVAIAAIAHLLGQREQPAGVYCVDQRLSLAAVVSRMREIDPDCLAGV